jgi:hypothetical protein
VEIIRQFSIFLPKICVHCNTIYKKDDDVFRVKNGIVEYVCYSCHTVSTIATDVFEYYDKYKNKYKNNYEN